MNRTIDIIKNIYKPHRITLKGNTTIFESTTGKFIVKDKGNSNIKGIFNYLISRNFDNFPSLIDGNRSELNIFEYIEEIPTPKEQKALDIVDVISNLHTKTTYYKEVTEDQYKSIYEDVLNNIEYLSDKYNKEFERIIHEVYMSPADYLLIRNSTQILGSLEFCRKELDSWYKLVKEKRKQRVALVHNDLKTEHLVRNQKDYLISWEKSKVDTPILDFISLYKNEFHGIEFEELMNRYFTKYPLTEDEQKLLFILIAMPTEIDSETNEFNRTINIGKSLDYLYKTETLLRPYYTPNEEHQNPDLNKQNN